MYTWFCYKGFFLKFLFFFAHVVVWQEAEANDRKIGKLCEYASRNPLRIPKVFCIFFLSCFNLKFYPPHVLQSTSLFSFDRSMSTLSTNVTENCEMGISDQLKSSCAFTRDCFHHVRSRCELVVLLSS